MEILFTFYPSDPISKVVKRNKQFFEVCGLKLVNINVVISFFGNSLVLKYLECTIY